jgi:pimeloyl-ACP methyl ester carboxylesterase
MSTQIFLYKEAALHYGLYPGGHKILLAFHGFGQSQHYFSSLAAALQKGYTVYSFDLFYHGQSHWPDSDQPLTKGFWKEMITAFLKEQQIDRFSLVGFSLGGKFVLATFEALPEQTDEILFIAPDGIRTSFWYSLATYPSWARGYFKKIVEKPESLFKLMNLFRKLQIIDSGILRFAEYQMGARHQRERVYHSWMMSRHLYFKMPLIAELINKNGIKIKMFLGRYDKLMTQRNMQNLLRHVKQYDLEILDRGHSMLIEDVARYLKNKA